MTAKTETEFEKLMVKALLESGSIKHINLQDVVSEFEQDTLLDMLSYPSKIKLTDDGIIYLVNGEERTCPNYGASVELDSKWLVDKIPDVNFDVDQGGNVRKADEAEAAFCCFVIVYVISDPDLTKEYRELIKHYDFSTFETVSGDLEFKNFSELLNYYRSLQSRIINVCISTAKIKISSLKKDSSKFIRDGISDDLVIELRTLEINVKEVFRSFSTGVLSPTNVKNLTKLEILQYLDERDVKIQKLIEGSKAGTVFKILSLTSEYVSPIIKRRLNRLARSTVDSIFSSDKSFANILGDKSVILERWSRRYYKAATMSRIKEEIIKYNELGSEYKLPAKM